MAMEYSDWGGQNISTSLKILLGVFREHLNLVAKSRSPSLRPLVEAGEEREALVAGVAVDGETAAVGAEVTAAVKAEMPVPVHEAA